VLGLVVCALMLSLAYPLKEYLAQRSEIAGLEQQRRVARERVHALEERKRQLSDPAYIKAQARRRLQYVAPGETLYVVVTPSPEAESAPAETPLPALSDDGSWYERLWRTVRAADGAPNP
jgi:Septum formation initiator